MAGAIGIILENGKMLLIRRGTEPYEGYWCPPGGVQKEGESLEETVGREVNEETGLEVEVVKKLGKVRGPITGKFHTLFLCSARGGSPRPSPPETTDLRWISYEELPGLPIPPFVKEFLDELDFRELESSTSSRFFTTSG